MAAVHAVVLAGLAARGHLPVEPSEDVPTVLIDLSPPTAAPNSAPNPSPSEPAPDAAQPEPVLDTALDRPPPDVPPPSRIVAAEAPGLPTPLEASPAPSVPAPPVAEPVVALPPPPKPAALPRPAKPERQPRPVEKKLSPAKPPAAARQADGQVPRQRPAPESGAQTTAPVPSASSGSSAAGSASWQGALAAHLRRHLLPQNGQAGVASVRFSVDRAGRVLSANLVASAGTPSLDGEALAVFRRAQPLPAPPSDVPGGSFTFTIPIRFTAR